MAVAGFSKKDINIEVKEHILTIKGNREKRRESDAYVHKGISNRKFEKSFRLSEYTEVTGADMTDGILTVNDRYVPRLHGTLTMLPSTFGRTSTAVS